MAFSKINPQNQHAQQKEEWEWGILLWAIYVFLVIRSAWVSDDALITMRVVENFVHGYGPVFNVGERVQVFTHPLWFLLLSLLYAPLIHFRIDIPAQHIFFLIGVSFLISAFGMYFLLRWVVREKQFQIITGIALVFSRGFVDFSTSGLEYPLLALLLFTWFQRWRTAFHKYRIGELTLWFALLVTTRMDAALLVFPLWVYEVAHTSLPWKRKMGQILWGSFPFIAWELFAFIYYGFFLPNTFYAKVGNTGLTLPYRLWQGVIYLLHTWDHDPVTLFVIGLVVLRAIWRLRQGYSLTWPVVFGMLGLLSYLGYVFLIGGDFMQSRFFVPALAWAILLWGMLPELPKEAFWLLVASLVLLGINAVYPTFRPQSVLVVPDHVEEHLRYGYKENGVADERIYHTFNIQGFALIRARPTFPPLFHSQYQGIHWQYSPSQRRVLLVSSLGENGLVYGPSVHLVDRWALADALLARLPAKHHGQGLRVGHMTRLIPAGYLEALDTGNITLIQDEEVRIYYRLLHQIISAPLFAPERWKAIWILHTGRVRPPKTYLPAGDNEINQFVPSP